jgi:O-methyltransferase
MIKTRVRQLVDRLGYDLKRKTADLSSAETAMVKRVEGLTATGPWRIVGLMDAVRYVVENRIPGSIVECGVWRGGSMMVAAWSLLELGDRDRDLYLYDTFEGMSPPGQEDRLSDGTPAASILDSEVRSESVGNYWCYAGLESVRRNVLSTGYPGERIHFVQGKVEDTLPARAPEQIALLRLDTDWYESTKHELVHLYPRLVKNGVLIIDDYGAWQGARQAVDEFFASQPIRPLLGRMDSTGRVTVKTS